MQPGQYHQVDVHSGLSAAEVLSFPSSSPRWHMIVAENPDGRHQVRSRPEERGIDPPEVSVAEEGTRVLHTTPAGLPYSVRQDQPAPETFASNANGLQTQQQQQTRTVHEQQPR